MLESQYIWADKQARMVCAYAYKYRLVYSTKYVRIHMCVRADVQAAIRNFSCTHVRSIICTYARQFLLTPTPHLPVPLAPPHNPEK